MKSSARIDPQKWMTAPQTRAVMAALAEGGGVARFVGGCVRNSLIGRPVDDVDIATTLQPDATMAALEAAGIKAIATGIEHGTVTAVTGKKHFEITTLRRDAETFGRKARVEFTDDWHEDAARRDFTFNALYCDADGALYDPFDGRKDLKAGRVRFVGSPAARLQEDYLRAFRFFRFLAWYGRPPPDETAIDAIALAAPHLAGLSGERVQKEMLRLLEAADPTAATALMLTNGVLVYWLPESDNTTRLPPLLRIEQANALAPDPLRRLAALLADDVEIAPLAERWRLSKAMRVRLEAALDEEPRIVDLGAKTMRALVYRLGNETATDRLALHAARSGIGAAHPALAAGLATTRDWQAPKLPLAGDDVLALGIAAGADVGRLLDTVEEWWIAGDFAADRSACLAELARAAQQENGRQ